MFGKRHYVNYRIPMTTEKHIDFPKLPTYDSISCGVKFYSEHQMRAYVAADRAQRQAGQEPYAWCIPVYGHQQFTTSPSVAEEWAAQECPVTPLYTAPPAAPVPDPQRLTVSRQFLSDCLKHLRHIERKTVYDARDLREYIERALGSE